MRLRGVDVMGADFADICNATLTTPSSTTIGWRGAVVACHVRSHRPLQQCFLQQQLSTITQCTGSVSRCVLRSPVPASLEDFCARVRSLVGPQSCVPDRRHCRSRHWHSFHLRLDDGTSIAYASASSLILHAGTHDIKWFGRSGV
jgi:hypothetical protein